MQLIAFNKVHQISMLKMNITNLNFESIQKRILTNKAGTQNIIYFKMSDNSPEQFEAYRNKLHRMFQVINLHF